ncbi:MAG TPA: hypothetical protein EYQ20_18190 [candidate division Zixibacteria bacterium]|jgi:hypothetical protein|nr:hypothetical protein [Candidatus Latescibacterota bacterium]HIG48259.1 hypothetical protein [candidate division Zixibacteria bacterium]|tara:strand:+ start:192 stop:410 length:219 start_codon:yes stop_codon:yes gene_type:complete
MKLQFAIVHIDAVEPAINLSQLAPATAGHMGMVAEILGLGLNSIFYGFNRGPGETGQPARIWLSTTCRMPFK